jgi:predicted PurR-regulated permease PerM
LNQRDGARAVLLGASAVVWVVGVRLAAPFLVPFLLATFFAIATYPLVVFLRERGAARLVAVAAGVATNVAVLTVLGLVVARALRNLARRLPVYEEHLRHGLQLVESFLAEHGFEFTLATLQSEVDPGAVVGFVSRIVQGTASTLSQGVLVLIIVGFMLVEAPRIHARVIRAQPLHGGAALTTRRVRTYLLVKTVTSLITGVLAGTLCWVLGVDLPVLWGLVAYLLNYIPTIGSIIAALPPVAAALLARGPGSAAAVAVGYIVINLLIGTITEPRWMGRALGLSPLVVLLSMLVWGLLLGPVGALLSAPLTMITRDWLLTTHDLRWAGELLDGEG